MPRLLCVTGISMIAIGMVHIVLVAVGIRPWEGVSGLRKPVLFFVSTGLTVWSIGWVRYRQARMRSDLRFLDWVTGNVLCGCLALEVFLIAMQSWLGIRSHFNHDTIWSTSVELLMLLAIALATLIILRETWIAWSRSVLDGNSSVSNLSNSAVEADREMELAIRWGLLFLSISCGIGFAISFLGWRQIFQGLDPETYRTNGVPKFPHGATIHALQTLPLFAFFHHWRSTADQESKTVHAIPILRSLSNPTGWAVWAHLLLLGYAVRQTFHGWGRVPADDWGAGLLGAAITASVIAVVLVGAGLGSRWFTQRKNAKMIVLD